MEHLAVKIQVLTVRGSFGPKQNQMENKWHRATQQCHYLWTGARLHIPPVSDPGAELHITRSDVTVLSIFSVCKCWSMIDDVKTLI